MRVGLFGAALLAAALALPRTAAASAADIFHRRGLFGIWAVDCVRPPSVANPHVIYQLIDGGHVQRQVSVEPGTIVEVGTIDSAAETGPTELVISWRTSAGGVTNRILVRDGRMRVQDSTRSDGQKLVVGGRRVADKTEVPWFQRCGPGEIAGVPSVSPVARA